MFYTFSQLAYQGGSVLKSASASSVTEIISAIHAYNDTISSSKWLVQPTMNLRSESSPLENADEVSSSTSVCGPLLRLSRSYSTQLSWCCKLLTLLTSQTLQPVFPSLIPNTRILTLQHRRLSIYPLYSYRPKLSSWMGCPPMQGKMHKLKKKNGQNIFSGYSTPL